MSLLRREEKLWGVNSGYTLKEYWGGGGHTATRGSGLKLRSWDWDRVRSKCKLGRGVQRPRQEGMGALLDREPGSEGTGPEGPTVMRRIVSVICSLMRHRTGQVLSGS